MINEDNQITLGFGTIIISNAGLRITPEGFCSIVIYEQKINYGGREVDSFSLELSQLDLQDLIARLEKWNNQFNTIRFLEKEE